MGERNDAINYTTIERLKDMMGESFYELVPVFIGSTEEDLATLEQAYRLGETDDFARQAHSLKSSCASLGGETLAQLAAALERLGRTGKLPESSEFIESLRLEFARIESVLVDF